MGDTAQMQVQALTPFLSRTLSAAARRKIAAAQRARWVKVKAGEEDGLTREASRFPRISLYSCRPCKRRTSLEIRFQRGHCTQEPSESLLS
jgi:hypothetical protein